MHGLTNLKICFQCLASYKLAFWDDTNRLTLTCRKAVSLQAMWLSIHTLWYVLAAAARGPLRAHTSRSDTHTLSMRLFLIRAVCCVHNTTATIELPTTPTTSTTPYSETSTSSSVRSGGSASVAVTFTGVITSHHGVSDCVLQSERETNASIYSETMCLREITREVGCKTYLLRW